MENSHSAAAEPREKLQSEKIAILFSRGSASGSTITSPVYITDSSPCLLGGLRCIPESSIDRKEKPAIPLPEVTSRFAEVTFLGSCHLDATATRARKTAARAAMSPCAGNHILGSNTDLPSDSNHKITVSHLSEKLLASKEWGCISWMDSAVRGIALSTTKEAKGALQRELSSPCILQEKKKEPF